MALQISGQPKRMVGGANHGDRQKRKGIRLKRKTVSSRKKRANKYPSDLVSLRSLRILARAICYCCCNDEAETVRREGVGSVKRVERE